MAVPGIPPRLAVPGITPRLAVPGIPPRLAVPGIPPRLIAQARTLSSAAQDTPLLSKRKRGVGLHSQNGCTAERRNDMSRYALRPSLLTANASRRMCSTNWRTESSWSVRDKKGGAEPPPSEKGGEDMIIQPITFRQACEFIVEHHRHHKPTVGCKFALDCLMETKWSAVRCPADQCPDTWTMVSLAKSTVSAQTEHETPAQCFTAQFAESQRLWGTSVSSPIFCNQKTAQASRQATSCARASQAGRTGQESGIVGRRCRTR